MAIEVNKGFDCCKKYPCIRDDGINTWQLDDGTIMKICPARLVSIESVNWLKWFVHYKNGLLPIAGGLLDQAAMYVDAMTFIANKVENYNG